MINKYFLKNLIIYMCHVCAINYTILYALCVLVNINVMYVGAKTKKKKV